jgi:hypothetical protein
LQQILIKSGTISHFFQETILGILTGNRQQLKEAVDPGEGFMDPMEEAALQQMIAYTL